jgi:uncharacterized protein (DUF433 family)
MNEDDLLKRIRVDLNVLSGEPIIPGTRLSVSFLINLLAHGATTDQILQEYKGLAPEDIQASLLYVARVFDERGTYTSPETYGVARRAQAFYDEGIRARVETTGSNRRYYPGNRQGSGG